MSRHHGPHTFRLGEEVTVIGGGTHRIRYPGVVTRVTPTQVSVTYDASRTRGRKSIEKTFWGASGEEVSGFSGGPRLCHREPGETFP